MDYTQYRATPEVNTDAALAALLGGHFLATNALENAGRSGMETFPLRLWCWSDGASAAPDPASFAHLLLAQKLVADGGPTPFDRQMGRSMLVKSLEEAASSYHPLLHRECNPLRSPNLADLTGMPDALDSILHILSPSGTQLFSPAPAESQPVERPSQQGQRGQQTEIPAPYGAFQQSVPPSLEGSGTGDAGAHREEGTGRYGRSASARERLNAMIAQASLAAPWAPEWMANLIDHKPLPYDITATFTRGGSYWRAPRYLRCYLGGSYGLASIDLADSETIPVLAYWRRTAAPVESTRGEHTSAGGEDLGTLILRESVQPLPPAVLQYHNKLIALTGPGAALELLTRQHKPGWRIYVDDQPLNALPVSLKSSSRVTIKDGISYLGIIPIPAGEAELRLQSGEAPAGVKTALSIAWSLGKAHTGTTARDPAPVGFVLELADAGEYPQFADFQRHIRQDHLEVSWEAKEETLRLALKSGGDTLELGYRLHLAESANGPSFLYRRVNDHWPYLAEGIARETTLSVQGSSGHLQKNDAELACEPGVTGLSAHRSAKRQLCRV